VSPVEAPLYLPWIPRRQQQDQRRQCSSYHSIGKCRIKGCFVRRPVPIRKEKVVQWHRQGVVYDAGCGREAMSIERKMEGLADEKSLELALGKYFSEFLSPILALIFMPVNVVLSSHKIVETVGLKLPF
jgi:hypothetical protein